jgi:competence protein ComEC
VVPDAAAVLASADGWLAAYLSWCARLVGGLPHARLSAAPTVAVAALVLVLAFMARDRGRRRRLRPWVLLAAVVTVLAWQVLPGVPAPPPPTGLRITFLDVGQGDGALVQVPEGAVLVDEGPPEAHVARQLRRLGVHALSVVVLTHPQRDHIGGAADVLGSMPVRYVLDPELAATGPDEVAALAAARRRQVAIVAARPGVVFHLGRLRVQVLWPDGPGLPSEDPNAHAIVLLVSYGKTDALFTADAESDVLLPLRLPPVEILKVSHHGSDDVGLPRLLYELRPRVAVISVGRGNTYGHPTPETLAALSAERGLAVYRTDEDGAVTIESDGQAISVATEH